MNLYTFIRADGFYAIELDDDQAARASARTNVGTLEVQNMHTKKTVWKAGIKISRHAINRYRERTGCKKKDDDIRAKLLDLQNKAQEVKLKKAFRVITLINHNCKEARYFKHQSSGLVFVVEEDTLVTIHKGTADKWEAL